jgi:antitoxin (DNA-binding transcriptional repressor) of toxin-antitoxin stability system
MLVKNNHKTVQVSADEMGHNWPDYLRRVEEGETLIILKEGKPIAEIKPPLPSSASRRPYGLCAGEFTVPDDFDTPLPENIIRDFE